MNKENAAAAVSSPDFANFFFADVKSLIPRNPFPLIFAAFANAFHRVFQSLRIVYGFRKIEAANAELTIRERTQGIALYTFEFAILDV